MDSQLKSAIPSEGDDAVRGGMPFERPLDMPVQDLHWPHLIMGVLIGAISPSR